MNARLAPLFASNSFVTSSNRDHFLHSCMLVFKDVSSRVFVHVFARVHLSPFVAAQIVRFFSYRVFCFFISVTNRRWASSEWDQCGLLNWLLVNGQGSCLSSVSRVCSFFQTLPLKLLSIKKNFALNIKLVRIVWFENHSILIMPKLLS